jgi:hypothetical protein
MTIASPDIRNYTIGKGLIYIKTSTDAQRRAIGNCPEFEFTPEIEKLEHFSAMSGVRERDRTVVLEKKGTLRIVIEEMTAENLRLALLGTLEDGSSGDQIIDIFSESQISAEVWFEGQNDVGPKWNYYFGRVDFIPSSGISLISDEWMTVELNGDVQKVNGTFGTAEKVADGTA